MSTSSKYSEKRPSFRVLRNVWNLMNDLSPKPTTHQEFAKAYIDKYKVRISQPSISNAFSFLNIYNSNDTAYHLPESNLRYDTLKKLLLYGESPAPLSPEEENSALQKIISMPLAQFTVETKAGESELIASILRSDSVEVKESRPINDSLVIVVYDPSLVSKVTTSAISMMINADASKDLTLNFCSTSQPSEQTVVKWLDFREHLLLECSNVEELSSDIRAIVMQRELIGIISIEDAIQEIEYTPNRNDREDIDDRTDRMD